MIVFLCLELAIKIQSLVKRFRLKYKLLLPKISVQCYSTSISKSKQIQATAAL